MPRMSEYHQRLRGTWGSVLNHSSVWVCALAAERTLSAGDSKLPPLITRSVPSAGPVGLLTLYWVMALAWGEYQWEQYS